MRNLIVLFLLLNFALLLADGVQPEGSGTENDPYQIATLDNLLWMSTNNESWSSYFIQTADIDASATHEWNDGHGLVPIGGVYGLPFMGTYDGQEHTIENLNTTTEAKCIGLFGVSESARIANLTLQNTTSYGLNYVGSLVGFAQSTEIENCHASGSVESYWWNIAGGLAGAAYGGTIITNCSSTVDITSGSNAGGIVGECEYATLTNCWYEGTITIYDDNGYVTLFSAGGLISWGVSCTVESCHANATLNVTGDNIHFVGGFIGWSESTTMSNCYASGQVNIAAEELVDCIGGFAGTSFANTVIDQCYSNCDVTVGVQVNSAEIGGFAGNNLSSSIIRECYCYGTVTGGNSPGGFVGRNAEWSSISNCYCACDVSGDQTPGGFAGTNENSSEINACFWNTDICDLDASAGGTGISNDEMRSQQTFLDAGWDFMDESENGTDDYWGINPNENNGYPFLHWQGYVGVDDPSDVPAVTSTLLLGNYPNPFNPETTISFSVMPNDTATLAIYNLKGQKVKSFPIYRAGEHKIVWNGRNDSNKAVSSGMYLCKLQSKNATQTRKLVLMK